MKNTTRTDIKKGDKNSYAPKSGKGKLQRSPGTGRFNEGSVRQGASYDVYKGKSDMMAGMKHEKKAAFVKTGKESSRNSTVMTPVTTRPESQMTSIEKMEATREGISKKALEELKDKSGFDYDQLSRVLGVARTTLLNKKGTERFPLALSEKIMSLADLYSFGYEIFGDPGEFNQWIFEPLPALGGQAPYDLLDNQYGREEVKNLIGRIAYGVYS